MKESIKVHVLRYFFIILFAVMLFPLQIIGQCDDFYEWGEDNYKKKKYDKAEKYFYKALRSCAAKDIKGGCWFYLMDIYKNYKKNDSLYFICKKALVGNGYETPGYRIEYSSINPDIYIPVIPAIDLYPVSRELCCELYEKGEYDSALFYFKKYAIKYYEKGWCGNGKENNYMYDKIMESRILAAMGDSIGSIKHIKNFLTPYYQPHAGSPSYYLAIFSFYENVMTLYPHYKRGEILNEMINSLEFISYTPFEMRFKTMFRNEPLYFTEEWLPKSIENPVDTIVLVDSIFKQTLLYRMIEFKDMLRFDSVVTIRGFLSFGTGYINFYSMGIPFTVEGWNINEQPEGDIELTGKIIKETTAPMYSWDYDSKLMAPEIYSQKTIQVIRYKTFSR